MRFPRITSEFSLSSMVFAVVFLSIAFLPEKAYCISEEYYGGTGSYIFISDSKNSTSIQSIDLNGSVAFLNAGAAFRKFKDPIKSNTTNTMYNKDITAYFGVGIINLLQAQIGLNQHEISMRFRSELVLHGDTGFPLFYPVETNFVPTPSISTLLEFTNSGTIRFGVGVGMAW